MADKQPRNNQAMRKHPLSTTAYRKKTNKQKKTNEEKQAKEKELDRTALRGGALEAGLARSSDGGVHSLLKNQLETLNSQLIKSVRSQK